MATKSCTIQYRYLKEAPYNAGRTLQQVLVSALGVPTADGKSRATTAKSRIIDLDQDGAVVILNKLSAPTTWSGPFIGGQLIQLQEGTDVQAIRQSLEEDAEEYLLERLELDQSRVVRGVLYFVVNGSHVGIVEGHQLRTKMLERYFTRLFQDTGILDAGQIVILPNKLSVSDGKGLTSFNQLTISAKHNEAGQEEKLTETERARTSERGKTVFDVLEALGWTPEAILRLQAEIPADGWIEGFFRVAIKSKRKVVRVPRQALEEALRHVDPNDLGLSGDGKEKGGISSLSVAKQITIHGQLLDPQDAFDKIIDAMKAWADEGKIDCRFA